MAKWDNKKLEEELEKAKEDNIDPPVPVRTSKLSYEETKRRYEKG